MTKTIDIDFSSDRLIGVAADMVDDHNYISALKMLNKNAELHCNDGDSFMLYAEIYDDIGLYEKCVNYWFKFIDSENGYDCAEAYEGLAVAYMNLGNEHFSAFYYNKLLQDADELDTEERRDIINSFLSAEDNPLKFVWPPAIADYSDVISDGIELMKRGEYEKAIDEFDKVDEGNAAYRSSRNYIAMCNIICDKCEEAEAECLAILEKYPDNVQALTTLAAVKTEQKKNDESRALAEKLLSLDVKSTDDIYKIATVCCENKMHAEAYELFTRLEDELGYDCSVLYFKAVSAFNSGKYTECFDTFDKLVTVYPDALCARYYYDAARKAVENGEKREFSYFYRLPQEMRENSLKTLAAVAGLSQAESKKLFGILDISDCIKWCFDETEGADDSELQYLAATCAVKAELDSVVCDMLLNAFLSDGIKVHILTLLGGRNEDNSFGVVICHIYKRVDFRALSLGRAKRKNFITAYARLCAHFAVINSSYGEAFAKACEGLYAEMQERGALSYSADADALTAAAYLRSGVCEAQITRKNLSEFFGASESGISRILGEL